MDGECRIKDMYNYYNKRSGKKASLVADDVYEIIMKVINMLTLFYFSFKSEDLLTKLSILYFCPPLLKSVYKIQSGLLNWKIGYLSIEIQAIWSVAYKAYYGKI